MRCLLPAVTILALLAPTMARADYVTDWIVFADQIETTSNPPPSVGPYTLGEHDYDNTRVALAMFEALNAIDHRYESAAGMAPAAPGASSEAAAATAAYRVMKACLPNAPAALDDSYLIAMSEVTDAVARDKGKTVGEAAAALALKQGGMDAAVKVLPYQPKTTAGVWAPTALPAFSDDYQALKPWALPRPDAVRPGPPPPLTSARWATDYEETRRLGSKASTLRTPLQTIFARYRMRPDLQPTLSWIADRPGRRAVQNARMYALLAMTENDTTIAIADAKMHYGFWRPITATRNADSDGNDATTAEPGWTPLLNTPNHPEYPCGHCIGAASQTAIIANEHVLPPDGVRFKTQVTDAIVEKVPTLADYVDTVSMSRIYGGVHYRFSNEAAQDMGRKVAALVLAKYMRPLKP